MSGFAADRAGEPRRLVVGMTGSSAPQLGIALLRALHGNNEVETHLVMSSGAQRTVELESDLTVHDVRALADVWHEPSDLAAPISSGSFPTIGMVVIPCSMRTLASIASGVSDNLVARAADVTLKERRRLVVVPRETPLNRIHLRNMLEVTDAGAVVLPPMPAFYHRPSTIDDLLAHTVGKVLDLFGIEHRLFHRWGT